MDAGSAAAERCFLSSQGILKGMTKDSELIPSLKQTGEKLKHLLAY